MAVLAVVAVSMETTPQQEQVEVQVLLGKVMQVVQDLAAHH
jgi:hypothetical protein